MISDHSSGSSDSASVVEPFTSQNSTVTTRRSPSSVLVAATRSPQLRQNFASAGSGYAQRGQFMDAPSGEGYPAEHQVRGRRPGGSALTETWRVQRRIGRGPTVARAKRTPPKAVRGAADA